MSKEARRGGRAVLKSSRGKETILGPDHFSTISGGTLLERLLHAQGRDEEAK